MPRLIWGLICWKIFTFCWSMSQQESIWGGETFWLCRGVSLNAPVSCCWSGPLCCMKSLTQHHLFNTSLKHKYDINYVFLMREEICLFCSASQRLCKTLEMKRSWCNAEHQLVWQQTRCSYRSQQRTQTGRKVETKREGKQAENSASYRPKTRQRAKIIPKEWSSLLKRYD